MIAQIISMLDYNLKMFLVNFRLFLSLFRNLKLKLKIRNLNKLVFIDNLIPNDKT